ncbi:adenosylcobinamide kinase/adenosylcobinamide phosphate guanyltransferase [Reichenbachiella sp. 5M10]|uniref:bifunctional adenosylcobinamide kinase/adenosylcobinamide-phosphate guanylyltransferase n=1 Tax=Reichenbachiella sp. 5M10 TaxID=1889772 RepID=UPI000C153F49|nr:bifunctional adenosylcobinamide kinase/adenosylcobinamide-phosphate guanylyltransferase [Reichenbachiella sp. 5M10]PIB35668.1 adenosylcobinamide kinase/adenosylcobinamide phosphate guanyltransferase [Reichenbachiella sp. 5M10]
MITYISGGERSGKSRFAQNLALADSDYPYYLATAKKWDENFEERIQRHRQDRNEQWTTIEEQIHLSTVLPDTSTVVIDCVTLWLTNLFTANQYDRDLTFAQAREEYNKIRSYEGHLIIISNEIGMGLHAESKMGRDFVEIQGWTNQLIAQQADRAYFMVSGLPLTLK